MKKINALLVVLCVFAASVKAENWGQWRGPNFNATTSETGLPDTFDAEKKTNLAWACDLPGASNATPVVFSDHVYISSNNADGSEMLGLCLDIKSGKILWNKVLVKVTPGKVSGTGKNTLASPSPVTDGKQVCFTFGTGDINVLDTEGKTLWSRNLPKDYGTLTFLHGYSSTPLLYKDRLYVQVMRNDTLEKGMTSSDKSFESYLLCLDWKTGKEIFKTIRKTDAVKGENESYSSPIVYERLGRTEILLAGALWVSGHNPDDGKEYWHWGSLTPWKTGNVRSVAVPVANNDLIFAPGVRTRPVFAIKAGGEGDTTKTPLAWTFKDHDCAVPSPVLYDGFLYLLDGDKKKLTCVVPNTGEVKWSGSLETPDDKASFSSSPAAADGKLYCMNERGNVVIVKSQEFKILSRVNLDEGYTASSPAISQGRVFFRTAKKLYCISSGVK